MCSCAETLEGESDTLAGRLCADTLLKDVLAQVADGVCVSELVVRAVKVGPVRGDCHADAIDGGGHGAALGDDPVLEVGIINFAAGDALGLKANSGQRAWWRWRGAPSTGGRCGRACCCRSGQRR